MMIVFKGKFNLSKLNDKTYKFIGIVMLLLVLLGQIYSHIFPANSEDLLKKSDASWRRLDEELRRAEKLVAETEKNENLKENPKSEDETSQTNETEKNDQKSSFTFLIIILRVLVSIIGFLLIYLALFLYEDEQGKIQNKLENAWVKVNDAQTYSLSKHTVFVNTIAKQLTKILNILFGKRLFSLQAAGVSICFAVSAANLFFIMSSEQSDSGGYFYSFLYWMILGILPALIRDSFYIKMWLIILNLIIWDDFVSGNLYLAYFASQFNISLMVIISLGILFGVFLACLLFLFSVVIARKSLLKISTSKSFWKTAIFPILNCIPILVLIGIGYIYFYLMSINNGNAGVFWLILLFSLLLINVSFLFPTLLFLLISFFLIFHKFIWGIIDRPIYALQKLDIGKRTKLLEAISKIV